MNRAEAPRWLVLEIEVLHRVRIQDPDQSLSANSVEFLEEGTRVYGQLGIREDYEEWILIPERSSRGLPHRAWLEHWHTMHVEIKVLPSRKDYFDSTDSVD